MKVFRLVDGTSWTARLQDPREHAGDEGSGWETILFGQGPGEAAQRLVYRPAGWLDTATSDDLARALEEGVPVRVRWG